jgi:hypothetical protein
MGFSCPEMGLPIYHYEKKKPLHPNPFTGGNSIGKGK